ncbi:SIMPL domain-containing protein [Altibacter sp.]|uniref:SIMPL domain-containing protein n=1 Tax=Altibacter sp. TaxID=2024823 RepID=UPI000C8FD0C2|nr:SIMPL domain-containing protein [Altibacter sp.]MAP55542.1 SIMPL domain-containing protein [Altibacter sp.]
MKKIITLALLITSIMTTAQNPSLPPTVDVTGEGIVRVVPDQVTISVRVENTGKVAQDVKRENDRIVNEVLSSLQKLGIPEKDVRTQYIRLNKNYEYNTKTYNYAANQSIAVTLRDLSKYESLMDALLSSGINNIDNISFDASNRDSLESQARKKAVTNAKQKAEEYASVLNQTIGKAVSISEYRMVNSPSPMYKAMAMDAEAGGQQTMAPGEMEIRTTVNVSFLLE